MLEPDRPEAVRPDRALCLPTFSDFLIVSRGRAPARPLSGLDSLALSISTKTVSTIYVNKNSLNTLRYNKVV